MVSSSRYFNRDNRLLAIFLLSSSAASRRAMFYFHRRGPIDMLSSMLGWREPPSYWSPKSSASADVLTTEIRSEVVPQRAMVEIAMGIVE
jgi:hypothetical protein